MFWFVIEYHDMRGAHSEMVCAWNATQAIDIATRNAQGACFNVEVISKYW